MATVGAVKAKNEFTADVLTGSMFDYARPTGPDLLGRVGDFERWRSARSEAGVWPYSRVLQAPPGPDMSIADELGHASEGISLACQDYLGLTAHPAIREAAARALAELGPHSAGSAALAGNTLLSLELERALGEALGFEHVVLFPTGWAAGYGSIGGLVRSDDHIVMDKLAHACLNQGAIAATRNIYRHAHLDVDAAREILRRIRAKDRRPGIMVITEGLFSMDSDVPDIGALQETCREYGATLLVDVAHDFGSLGPQGGGALAMQDLVGKVDLVMGSFSKTFASNGGFLATTSPAVRQYVKFFGSPQTFSNALSPPQTAVVLEALRIVRSSEGDRLRADLLSNAETFRSALEARELRCLGTPSAIIPALIGDEALARIAWDRANDRGILVNLVQFPAVAVGAARFRMQLMATHRADDLIRAADEVAGAVAEAQSEVARIALTERKRTRSAKSSLELKAAGNALPALSPEDLTKILEKARLETYPAGTAVIQAGAANDALYIVQDGRLRIETEYQGDPLVLATFGKGEIVGEMSMLDGQGASATVVAETDTKLSCLGQDEIARLAENDCELGARLYRSIAMVLNKRLRTRNTPISPLEFVG